MAAVGALALPESLPDCEAAALLRKAPLRHLSLPGRLLSPELLEALQGCTEHLESLSLRGCLVSPAVSPEALSVLWAPSLQVIELSHSALGDLYIPGLTQRCRALRVLLLAGAGSFSDIGLQLLESASPGLTHLECAGTGCTEDGALLMARARPDLVLASDESPERSDEVLGQAVGACPLVAAAHRERQRVRSLELQAEEAAAVGEVERMRQMIAQIGSFGTATEAESAAGAVLLEAGRAEQQRADRVQAGHRAEELARAQLQEHVVLMRRWVGDAEVRNYAWHCAAPGGLALKEISMPSAPPSGVLIQLSAVALDRGLLPVLSSEPQDWARARCFTERLEEQEGLQSCEHGVYPRAMCTAVVLEGTPGCGFCPGDAVTGLLRLARFQSVALDPGSRQHPLALIQTGLAPCSTWLGMLGCPGRAAYLAMQQVPPKREELVVVIGAAGAVGSALTALCAMRGCVVYGLVRHEAQREPVLAQGAEGCCVCTDEGQVEPVLRAAELCGRVSLLFDTVGGGLLDAVLPWMALGGRLMSLGDILPYSNMHHTPELLARGLTWRGFRPMDHSAQVGPANRVLQLWVQEGRVLPRETVLREGLQEFQPALQMLRDGVGDARSGRLVLELDLKHTTRIQAAQAMEESGALSTQMSGDGEAQPAPTPP